MKPVKTRHVLHHAIPLPGVLGAAVRVSVEAEVTLTLGSPPTHEDPGGPDEIEVCVDAQSARVALIGSDGEPGEWVPTEIADELVESMERDHIAHLAERGVRNLIDELRCNP